MHKTTKRRSCPSLPEDLVCPVDYPTELTTEIWSYLPLYVGERHLKTLAARCMGLASTLRPLLFRHVNLVSFENAFALFELFQQNNKLPLGVRTLQISMDLYPFMTDENDEEAIVDDPDVTNFWKLWNIWRPKMSNIHTIIVCFRHDDGDFLDRLIEKAHLDRMDSLKKLHLRPSPDEYCPFEVEDTGVADPGPWDSSTWVSAIARLGHLQHLILSTPYIPFWPPTSHRVNALHSQWFAELPPSAKLMTFVLHCGWAEDHKRFTSFEEDNEENDIPDGLIGSYETRNPSFPPAPSVPGDGYTPTLVWTRDVADNTWEEDGEPYCGYGEHLYFDEMRADPSSVERARVYGYEADLLQFGEV
ncbi:hypothetical protein C8R47DRAFT_1148424, partial [Mycena vitilis]